MPVAPNDLNVPPGNVRIVNVDGKRGERKADGNDMMPETAADQTHRYGLSSLHESDQLVQLAAFRHLRPNDADDRYPGQQKARNGMGMGVHLSVVNVFLQRRTLRRCRRG